MAAKDEPPDFSQWWDADEFETCPQCGEKKLAPTSPAMDATGFRVCLACGIVRDVTPR
jgi:transcription elongation factor Elf1